MNPNRKNPSKKDINPTSQIVRRQYVMTVLEGRPVHLKGNNGSNCNSEFMSITRVWIWMFMTYFRDRLAEK
jgi:hypothetical protein